MNCKSCNENFNLKDMVPLVLNCCQAVVCQQCVKNRLSYVNQCPFCKINQSFDMYKMQECKSVIKLMMNQNRLLYCKDHRLEIKYHNKIEQKYLCVKCNHKLYYQNAEKFDSSEFFKNLRKLKDSLDREMKKDQIYQLAIKKLIYQDYVDTYDIEDFESELHKNIQYDQCANFIVIKNRITYGIETLQQLSQQKIQNDQINNLKIEIENLKEKNTIINQIYSQSKQQCEQYKVQLDKLQIQQQTDLNTISKNSIKKHENLKSDKAQLQNEIDLLQKQIQTLKDSNTDLQNQYNDFKQQQQLLNDSDFKQINSKLLASEEKFAKLQQNYDDLLQEKEKILSERNDFEKSSSINLNFHQNLKLQNQRNQQLIIDKDQQIQQLHLDMKSMSLFKNSQLISLVNFGLIQKWMKSPNLKLNLLYKGSENNFTAESFHRLCDNQGKTIIVIKSDQKQIFGGYSDISWNKKEDWTQGQGKSFLFSLTKNSKHNCVKKESEIYGHSNFLANFGNGFDMCINNMANDGKNYSRLGASYELLNGLKYGSDQANSYLGGSIFFKVEEIEVFQVTQ